MSEPVFKDRGLGRILKMLKAVSQQKSYVKVGIFGEKGESEHGETGMTNGELAVIHEYGAPKANIPARPFLGPSMQKNRRKYIDQISKNVFKTYSGNMKMEQLLGIIGAEAAADVKKFVTAGEPIPPPLQPATIERKGSDRPLVDTGQMIGAVSWQVMMDGEEESDEGGHEE